MEPNESSPKGATQWHRGTLAKSGIVSAGPTVRLAGRRPLVGLCGPVAIVCIDRPLGGRGLSVSTVSTAIEKAAEAGGDSPLVVLHIASIGGEVGWSEGPVSRAIRGVQSTAGMVAAFVITAFGEAFALATHCSPIVAHPAARIGYLRCTPTEADRAGAAFWEEIKAFDSIIERRPKVDRSMLTRLRSREIDGETAEAVGLVDGVCSSFARFIRGKRKED